MLRRPVLALVVCALLTPACGGCPEGYAHDGSAVLAGVAARIRPDSVAEAVAAGGLLAAGESRAEGMELELSLEMDWDGRFVFEGRGPVTLSQGHDGTVTWMREASGAVRQLELADRWLRLLPIWLLSGYWLDPSSGFQLTADRTRSTADRAAFSVAIEGTRFTGTLFIDTVRSLPTRFEMPFAGEAFAIDLSDPIEVAGRTLLTTLTLTHGDAPYGTFRFLQTTPVDGFSEGRFAPPPDGASVHFLDGASAHLETRRGRWGHLFVRVRIDGEPAGWFAFDTGANHTNIDRSVAVRLGLEPIGESQSTGLGGSSSSLSYAVDRLSVGPLRLDGPLLYSGDLSGIDLGFDAPVAGLLGMDVLSHAVVVYDVRGASIELHAPELYHLPTGAAWSPLLSYNGKPAVRVTFEDHTEIFTIDTGSPSAVIFGPEVTERLDLLAGRSTTARSLGGIGGSVATRRGNLAWIDWGGRRRTDVPVDFVVEVKGAASDQHRAGIVGKRLLEHDVVVFDMQHRRIAYLPHPTGPSR